MANLVNSGGQEENAWTPGKELVHWVTTHQLQIDLILRHIHWTAAVELAASSPQLWPHVERLVTLARPDRIAALVPNTPDRLRIPLLTGLTREQVRAVDNEALRWTCWRGRLAVAQWLADRFQLTAADARAGNNEALRWACGDGHLATAQWLTERFGLTAADARAFSNNALLGACTNGHLDVVQWLVKRFGLTAADACAEYNGALRFAACNGHWNVVRWLKTEFGNI